MTLRYSVRHFRDHEMKDEVGEPRFTASWSVAWNELHFHKVERLVDASQSIIEKIEGKSIAIVERLTR